MAKTLVVSEETVRALLEAHASLSAWYHELSKALHVAKGAARTPDDAARAAFVERMATDFPELASVVRSIGVPRPFVPRPPQVAIELEHDDQDEPDTLIEPAPARIREARANSEPPPPGSVRPPPSITSITPPPGKNR